MLVLKTVGWVPRGGTLRQKIAGEVIGLHGKGQGSGLRMPRRISHMGASGFKPTIAIPPFEIWEKMNRLPVHANL